MKRVRSKDGTTIAFNRLGDGPAVIAVGGATCDRAMPHPLAEFFPDSNDARHRTESRKEST